MKTIEDRIFNIFKDYKIYLVGGSVRDKLLNKIDIKDLDFATELLPEQTKTLLEHAGLKTYTIGIAFGTISCKINNIEIQITTYRKNENYQRDNRKPLVEFGSNIEDDLKRRDFTFNALAQDKNNNIIDLFNGISHLQQGIIETPLSPDIAFGDDPLRMLRAVRFKSTLNFNYSERIKIALKYNAFRLLMLSKERIHEELNKILLGNNVDQALQDLYDYNLLNYILPELTVLGKTEQESKFHSKNVWLHTIAVVKNIPNNITLKYAALFHDIGKPYVKTEENNEVHFYKHEEVSELIARSLLYRLKLSNELINNVLFLIRNHMRINLYDGKWGDSAIKRFINFAGNKIGDMFALSRADITSHRVETVTTKLNQLNKLEQKIEELKNYKEIKSPLDGNEIKKIFNLAEGKEIGKIKKLLLEAILNGELELNQDKQIYIDYINSKIYK